MNLATRFEGWQALNEYQIIHFFTFFTGNSNSGKIKNWNKFLLMSSFESKRNTAKFISKNVQH